MQYPNYIVFSFFIGQGYQVPDMVIATLLKELEKPAHSDQVLASLILLFDKHTYQVIKVCREQHVPSTATNSMHEDYAHFVSTVNEYTQVVQEAIKECIQLNTGQWDDPGLYTLVQSLLGVPSR